MSTSGVTCPVCGYPNLHEPAYDKHGYPSFEICPSCGVEFGYEDHSKSHPQLRREWIKGGKEWSSVAIAAPADWDQDSQLAQLLDGRVAEPDCIPGYLLNRLKARYGEPQRHYHTWDHIEALKRHFDSLKEHWHRPEPVLWALYWHDAIYDPTRPDNEELSAQLLEEEGAAHLSADDLAFAAEIIRATAKHEVPEGLSDDERADLSLFLDIDLSILGAPEPVFDQYEVNVRKEYAFVPEEAFRAGRAKVLKSFADRPAIYFTGEGQSRWDAQARRNLSKSLAQLAG